MNGRATRRGIPRLSRPPVPMKHQKTEDKMKRTRKWLELARSTAVGGIFLSGCALTKDYVSLSYVPQPKTL